MRVGDLTSPPTEPPDTSDELAVSFSAVAPQLGKSLPEAIRQAEFVP